MVARRGFWVALMFGILLMPGCLAQESEAVRIGKQRAKEFVVEKAKLEDAKAKYDALIADVQRDKEDGKLDAGEAFALILKYKDDGAKVGRDIATITEKLKQTYRDIDEASAGDTRSKVGGIFSFLATLTGVPEPIQAAILAIITIRATRGPSSKKFKSKDGKITDEGRERNGTAA